MSREEIYEMKMAIIDKYPSGIIRGMNINYMSNSQLFAIYKSIKNRKKVVPGQMSLFES